VTSLYRDVLRLIDLDGVLVVADVMPIAAPRVGKLARAAAAAREVQTGERWDRFWADVSAVPEFGPILQERSRRRLSRPPGVSLSLDAHTAALAQAGFRDVGEVWRVHDTAAIAAFR
jgi:hypothetical protein